MLIRCFISLFMAILFFMYSATLSYAWLIYHKPEFKGKVIDAENKEPIEGAVVVAVYYEGIFGFAEGITRFLDIKETITDQNGEFYMPSHTTLILNPLSIAGEMWVNIFKSGYGGISGLWGEWLKQEWQAPKGTYVIENGRPIIMLKKTSSIKEEEKYLYTLHIPSHAIPCKKMKSLRLYKEELEKELLELGIKKILTLVKKVSLKNRRWICIERSLI